MHVLGRARLTAGPRTRSGMMARKAGDGAEVVRVGLLGRSAAETCPNLLQRRSAAGSAARRSAEYQRFSSRTPAGSGPLQQIWTTRAAAGPCTDGGRGYHPAPGTPPGGRTRPRTPRRALCTRTSTFNRTSRVQNAPLESIMHISTITGPTRSSLPRTASAHTIPRRPPFQVAGSRRPLVRPRPRGPPASAARRAGPMVWKGRVGWRSHAQR